MPGTIRVIMQVEDNGCGFMLRSISPDHFGLYNMEERAESIGATLDIRSNPGSGTLICVEWVGEEMHYGG